MVRINSVRRQVEEAIKGPVPETNHAFKVCGDGNMKAGVEKYGRDCYKEGATDGSIITAAVMGVMIVSVKLVQSIYEKRQLKKVKEKMKEADFETMDSNYEQSCMDDTEGTEANFVVEEVHDEA